MSEPKAVSRFESNLLRILQFLLRRGPAEQALPLIFTNIEAPQCLSRTAVELIKDTLAKGCVSILARGNGWRIERHVRAGQVVEGRLWDRHPLDDLTLSFSEHTICFLIWITAEDPANRKTKWLRIADAELTLGDRVFFYFVFGSLLPTEPARLLRSRKVFTGHALCRLAYPDEFSEASGRALDFSLWTTDAGAVIIEALQNELRQNWIKIERGKSRIVDWQRMQSLGRSQELALTGFLNALGQAQRWDLARFLMPTLQILLPANPRVEWWTGGLHSTGPRLADRHATNQAALVFVAQLRKLKEWQQQAQLTAFYDDHYRASQLYQGDWEQWQGDELFQRAQNLLAQIEPLH